MATPLPFLTKRIKWAGGITPATLVITLWGRTVRMVPFMF
jgi:hypothetical protein